MKVDKIILDGQDKLNVSQETPVIKQELVHSMTSYKGHTVFEINCTTGTIEPAIYDEKNVDLKGNVRKKIITKPNCLYISCLNKKAAARKYLDWAAKNLVKV